MLLIEMKNAGVLKASPLWMASNTQYMCHTGSVSYGVSTDYSDCDVVGFCIPPKDIIFPHLAGEIFGFGTQKQRFNQWQQHHIEYQDKQYDITIYNIVQYFSLCLQNNPNCLDYLFTDRQDVIHTTQIGEIVRENRQLFLHKGLWYRMKGYAYSQLSKMGKERYQGQRKELVEKWGYDIKNGYHAIRLLLEAEMLMTEKDMDLKRHREQLMSIRRGEWSEKDLRRWAQEKEKGLEKVYENCDLPYNATEVEPKVKTVLLQCLEHHYGKLDNIVQTEGLYLNVLRQIQNLVKDI